MKKEPLVSVIVPIYMAEDCLLRCVESIMYQTYTNLEIILVEDGSPDRCPAICDNLKLMDSRIKVLHKRNGGKASAWNAGINHMTGEYVAFVDCKDFLQRSYVKTLVTICMRYHCEITSCAIAKGEANIFPVDHKKGKVRVFRKNTALLSRKIDESVIGKLYLASLFKTERFPVSDHFEFYEEALTYRLIYQSKKVAMVNKKLYYCYQSPEDSTSFRDHYRKTNFIQVIQDRIRYFEDKERSLLELSHEYLCLRLMLFYITCKKDRYNNNDLSEVLELYRVEYKRVMKNSITPFRYKLKFRVFYYAPGPCAFVVNKLNYKKIPVGLE